MYEKYGAFPRSGEILLMESRGNVKYVNSKGKLDAELVNTALLFSGYRMNFANKISFEHIAKPGFNVIFHDYQLEWTPRKKIQQQQNCTN